MTRRRSAPSRPPCPPHLEGPIRAETPEGVPERPEKAQGFEPPVAWLGGRELLANAKLIALHSLFGGKLDSRDWMTGVVNVIRARRTDAPAAPSPGTAGDDRTTTTTTTTTTGPSPDPPAADGEAARYVSVIEIEGASDGQRPDEFWFDYVADTGDGQMPTYNIAYLCLRDLRLTAAEGEVRLPRGSFLFVGGDTAYHVADYETLAKRFQAPFWWAFRDLVCEGQIAEAEMGRRRPVFGVPANHDYYDALDGFNRQFRRPITGEGGGGGREPQLRLPTFERVQEASYVALRLPFDWWLWGLDTEMNELDFRQAEFFRRLARAHAPKKLIVATAAPTTVFGKYLAASDPLAGVFEAVGLKRPFLRPSEGGAPERLDEGECRLDLSGDIHHYARYWGPEAVGGEAARPRAGERGDSEPDAHYASVVSGGGGAFFDPTNTYFGEVKEQALFPTAERSRHAVAGKVLNLDVIMRGGSVEFIGAFVAFLMSFAVIASPNTRAALVGGVWPLPAGALGPGLLPALCSLLLLIIAHVFLRRFVRRAGRGAGGGRRVGEGAADAARVKAAVQSARREAAVRQAIAAGLFMLVSFGPMAAGLLIVSRHRPLPPLGDSLMVFLAVAWAGLAAALYVRYTEHLNEGAKRGEVRGWEYWPASAMLWLAAAVFCAGLWLFGQSSRPAYLLADLAFLTVGLLVPVGLTLWAVLTGGARHGRRGKAGYVLIGAWHAVLQLTVAALLTVAVAHRHITTPDDRLSGLLVVILLGSAYAFHLIGVFCATRNYRKRLVAAWVVYGMVMLVTPALYLWLLPEGELSEVLLGLRRYERVLMSVVAVFLGAVLSCVWFGWYLAVSLVFNGHNNEAGSAARLEGYKQFVRIRLRDNDLTAYVIGFDEARPDGRELVEGADLRVIDQFTLTVK